MSQSFKPVRPSIKAIIVRDAQLLVIANRNAAGETFYILPGGGQEPFESAPKPCSANVSRKSGLACESVCCCTCVITSPRITNSRMKVHSFTGWN